MICKIRIPPLFALLLLVVSACAGEDGAPGEAGERGKQGESGAPGPRGKPGEPGAAGTNGRDGTDGRDGADGQNVISQISKVEPGNQCKYGGLRVDTALDADGNGELNTEEIAAGSSQYVCNDAPEEMPSVYTGDFHIRTRADLAEFNTWSVVVGNVWVYVPGEVEILTRSISGLLRIERNNTSLLYAPRLEHLGKLWAETSGLPGRLEVPALRSITELDLGILDSIEVEFPALERAMLIEAHDLDVNAISLPALRYADEILIWDNYDIVTLELPALEEVGQALRIYENRELESIDINSLKRMWGWLEIKENNELTSLSAQNLLSITFTAKITDNPKLSSCSVESIAKRSFGNITNTNNLSDGPCEGVAPREFRMKDGEDESEWALYSTKMDFAEAESFCENMGGHLAHFHGSEHYNRFNIAAIESLTLYARPELWLGYSRRGPGENFSWPQNQSSWNPVDSKYWPPSDTAESCRLWGDAAPWVLASSCTSLAYPACTITP